MIINKPFIDRTILLREKENDYVREFSTRNKASPINTWSELRPYKKENFKDIYKLQIDGVKLKFKHATVIINGRHKST